MYVGDEDILGLDVTMNDPSIVQILEGHQNLIKELLTFCYFVIVWDSFAQVWRLKVGRGSGFEQLLAKSSSLHVFDDQV